MSATRFALACAALMFASSARADEVFTNASGLTVSPKGSDMLRGMPVWREASGAVVALSEDPATMPIIDRATGNTIGAVPPPPECWDDTVTPAVEHALLTSELPYDLGGWQIAASPSELVVLRTKGLEVRLYRASCAGDTLELGSLTLPDHLAAHRLAWPMVDGDVVVVAGNGLVRIDVDALSATPIDLRGERPVALGNTPSGALWVETEAPPDMKMYRLEGTTLTPLSGHVLGFTDILPSSALGGVFLGISGYATGGQAYSVIGVEPEVDPFAWSGTPPYPDAEGFTGDGFISGADGSVWLRGWHDLVGDSNQLGRRYSLMRIGVDETMRDFDHDHLVGVDEALAGTSDLRWDTDDDGFADLYEIQRHTDASDASSHPTARATKPMRIGQSVLPVAPQTERVCTAAPPQADDDPDVCAAWAFPATGNVTPDGHWAFSDDESGMMNVIDTTDGTKTPFISVAARGAALASFQHVTVLAVSTDAIVYVGDVGAVLITSGETITRFAETPVGHDLRAVGVVGDMAIVRLDERYFGAGAAGVFDLGDVAHTSDGLRLTNIVALPDGAGWLGQAERLVAGANGVGAYFLASSFLYDEHLRLQGTLPYVGRLDGLGTWDGVGYRFTEVGLFFKRVFIPGKCDTNPWAFDPHCGDINGDPMIEMTWPMTVDFRVVPAALEPGEVLMASQHTYVRPPPNHGGLPVPVRVPDEDGLYQTFEVDEPRWKLWRLTANGAVDEWLSAGQFADATDEAGAAALTGTPLGEVTALRASASGSRVCVSESGRVWELSLEAGTLTGIRLAGAGTACAYDGEALALRDAVDLVRTVGGWLVTDASGAASCELDDGTHVPLDVNLVAVAEAELAGAGAVVTVDDHGMTWVGSDPCHGKLREQLQYDGYVWAFLYDEFLGMAQPKEVHDAIAQRPDGTFVVSGGTLEIFPAKLLWWMRPGGEPERKLMSQYLSEVSAMVTLPGGDPAGDWGHPPVTIVPIDGPEDPGEPDPEGGDDLDPNDGDPKHSDDGCAGGGAGLELVLVALAIAGRRRRDRR